jgi:hypothetical protein
MSDEVRWFHYACTQLAGLQNSFPEVSFLVLVYLHFVQRRLSCVKYTLCRQLLFLSQGIIVCRESGVYCEKYTY